MVQNFVEFDFLTDEDEAASEGRMNDRKRLLPLYVYDILKSRTNAFRHMTQSELIEKLEFFPYELDVERKALSRTLHLLESEGIGVRLSPNGVWYEHRALAA